MLVETLVFHADQSVHEARGYALERDVDSLLVEDRRDRTVGPVVDQGGLGGFADVIERVAPGQVVNQIPPGPGADQAQTQNHGARDDREEFQSELGEHQTFNTWGSAR